MINFNGELYEDDALLFGSQNRAFRYGDSLFESILLGFLMEEHFVRLIKGMRLLQMDIPKAFTFEFFNDEISRTCKEMEFARVRFTVFRKDGGLYTPKTNEIDYLIEAVKTERYNPAGQESKSIGLIKSVQLPCNPLSNLKTGNALPYVLAGIEQSKAKYDIGIILNSEGRVSEANGYNLFIIKDKSIKTPKLEEGCIEGTMRSFIVKNMNVEEGTITTEELKEADEIFLTNAVKAWVCVNKFGRRRYKSDYTYQLFTI